MCEFSSYSSFDVKSFTVDQLLLKDHTFSITNTTIANKSNTTITITIRNSIFAFVFVVVFECSV